MAPKNTRYGRMAWKSRSVTDDDDAPDKTDPGQGAVQVGDGTTFCVSLNQFSNIDTVDLEIWVEVGDDYPHWTLLSGQGITGIENPLSVLGVDVRWAHAVFPRIVKLVADGASPRLAVQCKVERDIPN